MGYSLSLVVYAERGGRLPSRLVVCALPRCWRVNLRVHLLRRLLRPVGGLAVHPSSLASLAVLSCGSAVLRPLVWSSSYLLDGNVVNSLYNLLY